MVICMQRRTNKKQKDDAVSPVVGVMLMLVVTIIIAAVVSMYAAGVSSTQESTPLAMIDCSIVSDGQNGRYVMEVVSVSEPVSTKYLKLVTSWSTVAKRDTTINGRSFAPGEKISGGNTTTGTTNVSEVNTVYSSYKYNSPIGYGAGVIGTTKNSGGFEANQWFGNYSITTGTVLKNTASSPVPVSGDAMQAVFGEGWDNLRTGDQVNVRLIYIPTGSSIFETIVAVQ